jgi:hypothetical protein
MRARKGETHIIQTVTVIGSSVAASPDGIVAIVLSTKESGRIGIAVTLEVCALLRKDIAAAEIFLLGRPGTA